MSTSSPRLSPRFDRALRSAALALSLAGASLLFADASAGIALPLVAIGTSLIAIELTVKRRGR